MMVILKTMTKLMSRMIMMMMVVIMMMTMMLTMTMMVLGGDDDFLHLTGGMIWIVSAKYILHVRNNKLKSTAEGS